MKRLIIFITPLLFLGIISCKQTDKTNNNKNLTLAGKKDTAIVTCNTNLKKIRTDNIDNEQEEIVYLKHAKYVVYKNLKTKKYTIKSGNKTLRKNLNYFAKIGRGIQILNDKNEIEYYTLDFKKLLNKSELPDLNLGVCGNVSCWKLEIERNKDYFLVKKMIGFTKSFHDEKWQIIDSIKNNNIKTVHFLNNKNTLEYDGNSPFPETILINYDDYVAIRINKELFFFEEIDATNVYKIKVKCKNHYGYFGISEIKYKELGAFEYNLAPFTLDNDQKGFIDYQGNEYLSKEE